MPHTASVKSSLRAKNQTGDFLKVEMKKLVNKVARLFHGKRAFVWIAFALLLITGAARPVSSVSPSPGACVDLCTGAVLTINEDNMTHTFPGGISVVAGDVVLSEGPCPTNNCSDILRFNNNARATPMTSTPTAIIKAVNYTLFSDCEYQFFNDSIHCPVPSPAFIDEFTGFKPTINLAAVAFMPESATGPTPYNPGGISYIINSDPTGTTAVGGQVTLLNKLTLLAPYIGLASVIAAAAAATVFYRRRTKDKDNN